MEEIEEEEPASILMTLVPVCRTVIENLLPYNHIL